MSNMTLLELKLRNFKGVKQFVLKTDGSNIRVFGDNATGKTTLFDSFVWLLFDKDSQNKKDFQIKTLTINGEPVHNLEHEVEGTFNLDGRTIKLRKVFTEKWTKKRGSVQQEFAGHTTDYFIDDVPSKKKDFTDLISQFIDEDAFKLLTSPTYFNEQLHWQKRRETLLEVCGDISDEEVISTNNKLSKLTGILGNRTIEDHKKVIAAKRKEINRELDRIPVRIDEVHRSIPDVSGLNLGDIEKKIVVLQSRVEEKETELTRIQNGGEISAKENRLREIEGELLDIKNQLNAETLEKVNGKRQEFYRIQSSIDNTKMSVSNTERKIRLNDISILSSEEIAQRLRSEWAEINQQTFSFEDHQTTCPSCGQDLPQNQIEEARIKAESHFNIEKSKKLERIQSQGKSEMNAVNELKSDNETLRLELNSLCETVRQLETNLSEVNTDIDSLQSSVKSVESDTNYQAKQKEADVVKKEIQTLRLLVNDSLQKVREEISQLKTEIYALNQDKAKFAQVEQVTNRIDELSSQEKELAAEFERLEEELYLTEEFTRAKVNLMEEKINSKFKYARFKLFDTQINGGLQETCVTTFEGVPYDSGLNNAARINVGLDIIQTLSNHYGFSAPIFVDNAEAVTKLIDINSQVISLIVSAEDQELRVETPDYPEAI